MPRDYRKPRKATKSPIVEARVEKGMTQEQLAEAIGTAVSSLSYWELGKRPVPLDTLLKIADVLQVDLNDLVKPSAALKAKYNIAAMREVRGMTQAQLADAVGMSKTQISNYETGKQNPSRDALDKLLLALGCTVEELESKTIMSATPSAILKARLAKGMTQTQLAEASGVPQYTISRYELNICRILDENLIKIANALEVPVESLKGVEISD